MRELTVLLVGILLVSTVTVAAIGAPAEARFEESSIKQFEQEDDVIERTLRVRGTEYTLRVNTSNHTVRVSAVHFGENRSNARYAVTLNGHDVISEGWNASQGETLQSSASLIRKYHAMESARNITLHTFYGSVSVNYNFTVPRQYEGQYLRPTITDMTFERLNRTSGRLTVTVRSDAKYIYPVYYQVWTETVQAQYLDLRRDKDENVTTGSIVIPVEQGEPFDGEIRAHSSLLNETGPLHSQWKFYGRPGDAQFSRVPFEPMALERVSEYTYVNESRSSDDDVAGVSDALFRQVLGVAGGVLLVVVVVGVALGRRRRGG